MANSQRQDILAAMTTIISGVATVNTVVTNKVPDMDNAALLPYVSIVSGLDTIDDTLTNGASESVSWFIDVYIITKEGVTDIENLIAEVHSVISDNQTLNQTCDQIKRVGSDPDKAFAVSKRWMSNILTYEVLYEVVRGGI